MFSRDEAREAVTHPGAFEGESAMTHYLYQLSMVSGQDEETGSVDWDVWCARFGKRLLMTGSQGFYHSQRFATEEEAKTAFAEIDRQYCEWADEGDTEF